MSFLAKPAPLSEEAEMELLKVQRVNQSWIVHGQLKDTAASWIARLHDSDPERLEKSCWMALFLTHYRKNVLRDPKPLFYAGLFAFATREEVEAFLEKHPMTRAISLLGFGDTSGLDRLGGYASDLALGIAGEIQQIRNHA